MKVALGQPNGVGWRVLVHVIAAAVLVSTACGTRRSHSDVVNAYRGAAGTQSGASGQAISGAGNPAEPSGTPTAAGPQAAPSGPPAAGGPSASSGTAASGKIGRAHV